MKEKDCLRRFLFEELSVRGEWVCLQKSWQQATQHQHLSVGVQEQLGQALAAAVLLSASIKFDGSLVIQAQGNGALKAVVAQSTNARKIRGLARCGVNTASGTLSEMMGQGRLVITIEPKQGEPYQGIVLIEKGTLADAITRYFLQSEQLKTCVWLFANETHAAGLFLQQLPGQENDQADWEHIVTLANTVTKDEMLTLDSEKILYRLFNQEKVRMFDPETVGFECGCSQQKIETTLVSLGREELERILQEREVIDVGCEFCGAQYSFDNIDVELLFSGQTVDKPSKMRH
jgi:molecular chaperone Hsp33